MSEVREITNLHPVRVGKIKKLTSVKKWKHLFFVEIEFDNGEYVKHFTSNPGELNQYVEGARYVYQIESTTIIDDIQEPTTKNKLNFCQYLMSPEVASMLKWPDLIHRWLDTSAEQAVASFKEKDTFSEVAFKERASVIFDWKLSTLKTTEFYDTFGEEFDERLKNALES